MGCNGIPGQLTKVLNMIKQEICLRVKKRSSSSAGAEKLETKLNNLIKRHMSESCLIYLCCIVCSAKTVLLAISDVS